MADRSVVYRLVADTAQFKREMGAAGQATDQFGDRSQKATAKASAGMDMLGLSSKLGAAEVGRQVIMTAANFEQGMSNVQAATMESAESMEVLRQAALDAGAETAFSATEATGAIENLAKAGVSTADILDGGLSGALDLAAAGELQVADAAEIAATAMTQFKLSGQDVPHIADLLAAGAGKAQGDVSDLSAALKQSGLVAAQMGISIEETTGTLAAFASAGLLGSDAGTSFRTMLLRLANPTKESAKLMAQLGIQAYDANGAFVGMASIAGQLQAAFEGKTQAERDSAMATLFGSDAIRAANVLYTQGQSGISGWTTAVDDSGYAAEQAAIRMDNLKGKWEEFTGALETAMIGHGDGSMGPLGTLLDTATAFLDIIDDVQAKTDGWINSIAGGPIGIAQKMWTDTKEALKGTAAETENAENAMEGAAEATDLAAEATGGLGEAASGALPDLAALAKAQDEARKAAFDQADAFVNLGDSLNDAKVSLGDWIGQMEKQAKALADFRKNAQDAAKRGLDEGLIASLREAGPEGAMRLEQLANASKRELGRANAAFRNGQKQVDKYADAFGNVPGDVSTDVHLNGVNNAMSQVQSLAAQVRAVDGMSATAYVNVVRRGQRSGVNPLDPYDTSADGSTVPKDGGTYADRYPYLLAPGEEVISNRHGQADRWRPLLKAINAGRMADGGTVGRAADGATVRATIDERMEIIRLRRELRGLTKALGKDGKDRLKGLARQEAILQRQGARRDLRQARGAPEKAAEEKRLEQLRVQIESQRDAAAMLRDAAKEQQEAAQQQRDAVKAQYDAAKAGTMSNVLSGDLFGGGTLASFDRALNKQVADAAAFETTLSALVGMGLDGDLLEEASSRGDLKFLQQLVGVGAGGIEQYEQLYAQANASAARSGELVGDRIYGEELRVASEEAVRQTAALEEANERWSRIETVLSNQGAQFGQAAAGVLNDTSSKVTRQATASGRRGRGRSGGSRV